MDQVLAKKPPKNRGQINGGVFCQKANFGFFEKEKSVQWKGKFWPKFSQNLPLQPKFAFSQNHWNMPKNWNLCPFRHSINFLDESHCKGTEELIQKNNWSHKKFSYFITEVPGSSFFDSDSGSETVQSRNSVPIPIPRLSMARRRFRVRFRDCTGFELDSDSGSETAQA